MSAENEKERGQKKETAKSTKGSKKKEKRETLALLVNNNRCACCLKPFMIGGAVRCGDCGAQICQQMCSRLNRQFGDHWCCLFCYQKRLWLHKNDWMNSFNRQNIENDLLKSFTVTHICKGASGMAPVEQVGDCDKLEAHTKKLHASSSNYTVTDIPASKPLSIKMVEESIEEITDFIVEDKYIEPKWEHSIRKPQRVPFPEFGVDIVDAYGETPEMMQHKTTDSDTLTSVKFSENWKENWLFRKKLSKTYSKPVAMFVPNSKTKYRALIGDTDADETSDLSEYSTPSDEEIELQLKLQNKNEFPKNNESESIILHTVEDSQSNVTIVPINLEHHASSIKNPRNENVSASGIYSPMSDTSNSNSLNLNYISKIELVSQNSNFPKSELDSFAQSTTSSCIIDQHSFEPQKDIKEFDSNTINGHEQDKNCKEDYLSAVDKKYDINMYESLDISKSDLHSVSEGLEKNSSPSQSSISISNENDDNKYLLSNKQNSIIEINLSAPPKPGTIADREHKKWENAAPIKNNPYSKDNIHRRLEQKRNSSVLSDISGRNYYVRNNSSMENETSLQTIDKDSNSTESKENVPDVVHTKSFQKGTEKKSEVTDNAMITVSDIHNNGQSTMEQNKEEQNIQIINIQNQIEPISPVEIRNALTENVLSKSCTKISDNTITTFDNKSDNYCTADVNNKTKSDEINYKDKELVSEKSLKDKIFLFDHHRIKSISTSLESFSNFNEIDPVNHNINNDVQLPSVKELVEVFNAKEQNKSIVLVPKQLNEVKTESSSRQNQVNQSPKQLHSLTARSLSKEFRDELRQIPNKANLNIHCENHFK